MFLQTDKMTSLGNEIPTALSQSRLHAGTAPAAVPVGTGARCDEPERRVGPLLRETPTGSGNILGEGEIQVKYPFSPDGHFMNSVAIKGSLVAIVTPMHENGELDLERFSALIDYHVAEGTDGIVVVGTTGESPTVDFEEHHLLIRTAVERAAGRVPVIAGTGANSTREAIDLSIFAKDAGADASLSVVPYYNKPTQEGLYRHFRAVAEAVEIPQILYNVPGRTVADLANETVLRLAEIPNIVGIKDATGDMGRGFELLSSVPQDFAVFSGDDASGLALLLLGCHGVISVTANVAPRLMHEMCVAAFTGDFAAARTTNGKLLSLHADLFIEANPIPVKWAVAQMGLIGPGLRLPLTQLSDKHHQAVMEAMRDAGTKHINGWPI
ncbi:dihydrodipicolinate synthase [Nitrosospira sp. Nsp2]|nr:dihydrodipicolinate synthase [Nitrosospira sp. Nsp2]